jgi:hypothetical protein
MIQEQLIQNKIQTCAFHLSMFMYEIWPSNLATLTDMRAVCQLCICIGDEAASRMAGQQHLPMRRPNHDGMSKCTTKLKSRVVMFECSCSFLTCLDSGLLSRRQGPGTTSCVVTLVLIMAPSLSFFFSTCPRLIDHGMSPFWVLLAAVQLVPPTLTPAFRQSTSHACCLAV